MAQEVYMDTPKVQKIADQFGTFGDILTRVSKVLEMTINVLRVTAFVGQVGGFAVEHYLSLIKPRIDRLAKKMLELQGDVQGAISNFVSGDTTGSARFR